MDNFLYEQVTLALNQNERLHASNITVAVSGDIVMLLGTVPSFLDKWQAERCAAQVKGVKAVLTDKLVVDLPGSHTRSDTEIAKDINHRLAWEADVPEGSIHVQVENGKVTLTGMVANRVKGYEIEASLRHIAGVHSVLNRLVQKSDTNVV
jgi:osmotically-inducible protein OsmY